MRILFVCDYFPPFNPGGAEWSTYYLAQALSNKKFKVIILTPNYGQKFRKSKKDNFKIVYYPFPFKLKPGQATLPYFYNHNLFYYIYSFFWLLKIVLREKIDLIHLQSRFSLPAAVLVKLILKIPLFFTIRDTIFFCPTGLCLLNKKISNKYSHFNHFWQVCSLQYISNYLKPKKKINYWYCRLSTLYLYLDNLFKRKLLKYCDKNIFISQSLRKLYLDAKLTKLNNSEVVYNFQPFNQKKLSLKQLQKIRLKLRLKNQFIVLFVGRLTLGKGVSHLIKTAKIVQKQLKNVFFLLIGKGKIKVTGTNIKIIASQPHRQIFQFYQLADIIVVPTSGFEPFGRIPQEAALYKKPVIATLSGGLSEQIINNETGYLVPKDNPSYLAKAIIKLYNSKQLRLNFGEKHFQYSKNKFSQQNIIKQLTAFYKGNL